MAEVCQTSQLSAILHQARDTWTLGDHEASKLLPCPKEVWIILLALESLPFANSPPG